MERAKIINLIRESISLAYDASVIPYTDEELDAMHNFLNEIEISVPKRSSDDWRGCQGTCDFDDPGFNVTGWI